MASGRDCEASYKARVSGPLLDRIDIAIELQPVTAADLARPADGEPTRVVAGRVAAARALQTDRESGRADGAPARTNAALDDAHLSVVAAPDAEGAALLARAAERIGLSARAYTRTLRLARTLADLDSSSGVRRRHVSEAIAYRGRAAGTASSALPVDGGGHAPGFDAGPAANGARFVNPDR